MSGRTTIEASRIHNWMIVKMPAPTGKKQLSVEGPKLLNGLGSFVDDDLNALQAMNITFFFSTIAFMQFFSEISIVVFPRHLRRGLPRNCWCRRGGFVDGGVIFLDVSARDPKALSLVQVADVDHK